MLWNKVFALELKPGLSDKFEKLDFSMENFQWFQRSWKSPLLLQRKRPPTTTKFRCEISWRKSRTKMFCANSAPVYRRTRYMCWSNTPPGDHSPNSSLITRYLFIRFGFDFNTHDAAVLHRHFQKILTYDLIQIPETVVYHLACKFRNRKNVQHMVYIKINSRFN